MASFLKGKKRGANQPFNFIPLKFIRLEKREKYFRQKASLPSFFDASLDSGGTYPKFLRSTNLIRHGRFLR